MQVSVAQSSFDVPMASVSPPSFGAAIVHAPSPLTAVMGSMTALMEVMKLDVVVSYQSI